jgi:hypothetical protein
MKKKPRFGYHFEPCPICNSPTFEHCSYSEWGWGTVERHGYCDRCGYIVDQAYSPVYEAFWVIKRGFKRHDGVYVPKNIKRHKRLKRKSKIRNIEVNPIWLNYV